MDQLTAKLRVLHTTLMTVRGKCNNKKTTKSNIIGEIEKSIIQVNQLMSDMKDNDLKQQKMMTEIADIKNFADNARTAGTSFSNKLTAGIAFLELVGKYIEYTGGIVGSFNRQLFELPFALKDSFKTKGYGQPSGRDLDFILFNNPVAESSKDSIQKKLKDLMDSIQQYLTFYNLAPESIPPAKIGHLTVVDIVDCTLIKASALEAPGKKNLLNIPHYIIKLIDENKNLIEFDILAWYPKQMAEWPPGDFDVNTIMLKRDGITINKKDNSLFKIIDHISKKEAMCEIDFKALHSVMTPYVITPRTAKIPNMLQMAFFFVNRLKIREAGYSTLTSVTCLPEFSVETKDDCYITGCNAPYINIKLECKHSISTMAFIGMFTEGKDDYSGAVKCPQCRKNLLVKFDSEKKPSCIDVSWDPVIKIKKTSSAEYKEETKIVSESLFSEDSLEYTSSLAKSNATDEIATPITSSTGARREEESITNIYSTPVAPASVSSGYTVARGTRSTLIYRTS